MVESKMSNMKGSMEKKINGLLHPTGKFRYIHMEDTFPLKYFEGVYPAMSNDQFGIASNGYMTAVPWMHTSTIAVFPSY
jgi:hypothetical protein